MLPSTIELFNGLLARQRYALARSITLIESSRSDHQLQAQILLQSLAESDKRLLNHGSTTLRLGVAGPPGIIIHFFSMKSSSYIFHRCRQIYIY